MAYMSAIAYDSVLNVQAWNCKLFQAYKIALPKSFFNLTSGVRGFTGYSSSLSSIVVSFKGADSISTFIDELKTARVSFDKCPGCEVSKSFSELYMTVQASILSQIESLHRIYRNAGIYVTGHGLGGAFAILAATDIKQLYQNADAVYTFGQPRVGNEQFATYYG
jgi:predicted lipase